MNEALSQLDLWMPNIKLAVVSLALAVLTLIVGWVLASLAGRAVHRVARRSARVDPTIVPMVYTVTVWSIRLMVIIAVLARLGIQTASVITVLGAAGVAIGLALQGTLQNIAAGIMLLVLRPLRANEDVSVVGKAQGKVQEVGLFLTQFIQDDGTYLSLPNSLVWGNPIVNYTRNGVRRLDFKVTIRHQDDLQRAMRELNELIETSELALNAPAPRLLISEYRDIGVVLTVRAWTSVANYGALRDNLYRQALERLQQAGLHPVG